MAYSRILKFLCPTILLFSGLLFSGCTTYVENVVSEDYEPIFQEAADIVEIIKTFY